MMKVAFLSGTFFEETPDRPLSLAEAEFVVKGFIEEFLEEFDIECNLLIELAEDSDENIDTYIIDIPVIADKAPTLLILKLLSFEMDLWLMDFIDSFDENPYEVPELSEEDMIALAQGFTFNDASNDPYGDN